MSGATIISGCGGGYDIFGGLHTYYLIKENNLNDKVILVNYTFTEIKIIQNYCKKISDNFYMVAYDDKITIGDKLYFPEWWLSKCLNEPIYLIYSATVQEIINGYNYLLENNDVQTIYLVDGGCDVLLTGDEKELATPVEDMMQLKAIMSIKIKNKIILALGVNVDVGDGVIQEELDQRLNNLKERNIMISEILLDVDDDASFFYAHILGKCRPEYSIVQSLVLAALYGKRGYYLPDCLKNRCNESLVNLSEQTCTLFQFNLEEIANDVKYFNLIEPNMSSDDVDEIIQKYQASLCLSKN
jgi:hypothetical protein